MTETEMYIKPKAMKNDGGWVRRVIRSFEEKNVVMIEKGAGLLEVTSGFIQGKCHPFNHGSC
jgi:hypothetical protein